jgi:hypothetical protein
MSIFDEHGTGDGGGVVVCDMSQACPSESVW